MIIINFILDYLIMIFLPIDTYFIVNEIDRNNLFNVVVIGILLDVMYHKLFISLFVLLFTYLLIRKFHVKKKYYYLKNVIVFVIWYMLFNLSYFNIYNFFISFLLQIIFMFFCKKLLN